MILTCVVSTYLVLVYCTESFQILCTNILNYSTVLCMDKLAQILVTFCFIFLFLTHTRTCTGTNSTMITSVKLLRTALSNYFFYSAIYLSYFTANYSRVIWPLRAMTVDKVVQYLLYCIMTKSSLVPTQHCYDG